tara:strand:- start:7004 stop:7777 length:774 start_codon:yes stop_codon:yes gene_type:complete
MTSKPPVGIPNVGNSCYLASTVQLLRVWDYTRDVEWLWSSNARALRHQVAQRYRQFNNNQQHDAHEFLLAVLDVMGKDVDQDASTCGVVHSTVRCPESKETSTVEHYFSVLTLPVRDTLMQSLVDFQAEETLCDGWKSPKMLNGEVPIEAPTCKRSVVTALPASSVVLHLKRFCFTSGQARKIVRPMPMPFSFVRDHKIWKLTAFVLHSGNPGGGHYVGFVREGTSWYCCNDASVRRGDLHEVEQRAKCAYLYLYTR